MGLKQNTDAFVSERFLAVSSRRFLRTVGIPEKFMDEKA